MKYINKGIFKNLRQNEIIPGTSVIDAIELLGILNGALDNALEMAAINAFC